MASIWEKMIIEERKAKAAELGLKVSELEEMENLALSIEENMNINSSSSSSATSSTPKVEPVPEKKNSNVSVVKQLPSTNKKILTPVKVVEHVVVSHPVAVSSSSHKCGPWVHLIPELVDRVLEYVGDPDMMGYLLMTSKSVFQPTERVYRFICESIYPKQTLKHTLNIDKWLSWRRMLINRPRLRLNGFYSLKTLYSRAPCNDNFWEPKQYQSIEMKYYRHLRFFDDGRVLYSPDIIEPDVIEKQMLAAMPVPKRLYEGTYTLVGQKLSVTVELHYCIVLFELLLCNGDDGYRGHHNMLLLKSHASMSLNNAHVPANLLNNVALINNMNNNHDPMMDRTEHRLPKRVDFRFHRFYNHLDLTNW